MITRTAPQAATPAVICRAIKPGKYRHVTTESIYAGQGMGLLLVVALLGRG